MEDDTGSGSSAWSSRQLTHEQARMEQHVHWSRKTVAERLGLLRDLADAEELELLPDVDLPGGGFP